MADESNKQDNSKDTPGTDEAFELAEDDPHLDIELPEESLFTLDDYLEMYRIASSRPGFAILTLLQTEGRLSTNELSEALNRESNKLHYHLRKLKDTALIRNRRDPNTGTEDVYSYYMLTDLGHTVLTQGVKTGVEKLAAEEHDIQEQYSK
jgi:predicted transcriptional regulator